MTSLPTAPDPERFVIEWRVHEDDKDKICLTATASVRWLTEHTSDDDQEMN